MPASEVGAPSSHLQQEILDPQLIIGNTRVGELVKDEFINEYIEKKNMHYIRY